MSDSDRHECEPSGVQPSSPQCRPSDAPAGDNDKEVHAHLDRVFGWITLLIVLVLVVSGGIICGGLASVAITPGQLGSAGNLIIVAGWLLAVNVAPTLPVCVAVWTGLSALAGRRRRPLGDCLSPHALGAFSVLACVLFVGRWFGLLVIAAMTVEALMLASWREHWRLAEAGEGGASPRVTFSIASLIGLTVVAASLLAVLRGIAGRDATFVLFACWLLALAYEAAMVFAATVLFVVLDRARWGWSVVIAASLLPGVLLHFFTGQPSHRPLIMVVAFVPHGVALGALLHYARRHSVRVVSCSPSKESSGF